MAHLNKERPFSMISKKSKIVGLLLVGASIVLCGCGKADDHDPRKASSTEAGDAKMQEYLDNGKNFHVDPKYKQGKPIFHN
jgi:hypothetical protein